MESFWEFLAVGVGAGGLGAVIGAVTTYLLKNRKLSQKFELDHDQQDFDQARLIIQRQEKRITHLEELHEECLAENARLRDGQAELRAEQGMLGERVRNLTDSVNRLERIRLAANVVTDGDGLIVDWDTGAAQIFHWSREEAIGRPVTMLTPARYLARHLEAFHEIVTKKRPIRKDTLEILAMTREGREVPVTITLSEVWDEHGKVRIGAHIQSR